MADAEDVEPKLEDRPDWVDADLRGMVVRGTEDRSGSPAGLALGLGLPIGVAGLGAALGLGWASVVGLLLGGFAVGIALVMRFLVVRTTTRVDDRTIRVVRSVAGRPDEEQVIALADVEDVYEVPGLVQGTWQVRLKLPGRGRYLDLPFRQQDRAGVYWMVRWLRSRAGVAEVPPKPTGEDLFARRQVESLLERL